MSEVLYRKVSPKGQYPAHYEPVERDYEAAVTALREYEGYVIDVHAGMARAPVRLTADAAREIVDAALLDGLVNDE